MKKIIFQLSKNSKHNREGVDPRLIETNDLAMKITVIDFGVPQYGGVRTADIQGQLYADGKSKADGITNLSKHQPSLVDGLGKALDFYAFVNGKASWKHDHLAMVAIAHLQAASMLGYKIRYGGLWQRKTPKYINGIPYGWDCAHTELID